MRRRRARTELDRLLQGRADFQVHFSRAQVAASLWDYGEDDHAPRALAMSDADLASVQAVAAWYEDPSYPLPLSGGRITHHHVTAFAAVTFFEGRVRPLQRTRRRPQKDRPAEYEPQPPDPPTGR
jgi:hypothetical protein